MEIRRLPLARAGDARGVVVVIDVIRAFTVAAYALAGGARCLWLVRTVEEARGLREAVPDALLAGEVGGRVIPGFDLDNSPARMAAADVRDRTVIQRTGAGTQGAVAARHASHLLVCALVNARATARYALSVVEPADALVTLVPTGRVEGSNACEDDICADYVEILLTDPDRARLVLDEGLDRLRASGRLDLFSTGDPDFPAQDVDAFLAVDRFSFAMPGVRRIRDGIEYVEVVSHA